nr:hypothetical protein 149p2_00069 [Serratia proteamaculans]
MGRAVRKNCPDLRARQAGTGLAAIGRRVPGDETLCLFGYISLNENV